MRLLFISPFLFLAILCLLQNVTNVESAKILFLIPMSTVSEKHVFQPLINELASTGHEVTVVTNRLEEERNNNVNEIMPLTTDQVWGWISDIDQVQHIFWNFIFLNVKPFIPILDKIYSDSQFQSVIQQKYDLIFTNVLFGQAFYGIIHKMGAPFILLATYPVPNYYLKDLGNYMPSSHVPYSTIDFTHRMNFFERFVNFIVDWAAFVHWELWQIPDLESVYKKHLGEDLPNLKEIHSKASMVFTNTHFLTNYQRPYMNDVVEIGGIHCRKPDKLDAELENFVGKTAAPEGFILISFGTCLRGSSMQPEMKSKFLKVISKLKQKVVWKWETEQMDDDHPLNLKFKKWLPQQDLLGHENIRLFISHAGLLSSQQLIYHGVPSILFPVYFDQMSNANNIQAKQIGIQMNLYNFTEAELESNINKILTDDKYRSGVKLMSSIMKDQITSPLERAVFWTNHVLKYGGASHLWSAARDLNAFQLHSFDIIGVLLGVVLLGGWIVCKIVKCIAVRCISPTNGDDVAGKKKPKQS